MAYCFILNRVYLNNPEAELLHRRQLEEVANGALPCFVLEAMEVTGWAVVGIGKHGRVRSPDKKGTVFMICYTLWVRAKQNGISNERFEQFMLDHMFYVENVHQDEAAAEARIRPWADYTGYS